MLENKELSNKIQKKKVEYKTAFDRLKESFKGLIHKLENPIIEVSDMQPTVT